MFDFVLQSVAAGTACFASSHFFFLSTVTMAALPRWDMCWSAFNLTSFLTWFGSYATEEEQIDAMQLYTVEHRRAVPAWLSAYGVVPQDVPLQVTHMGVKVNFPRRCCMEPNCERCSTGRGGYQFRWVDRRWTPSAALDLSLTPQQVQVEMCKRWPRGLLPIPRERMQPPAASSTASSLPPAGPGDLGSQPAAWYVRAVPEPPAESAADVSDDV